MQQMGWKWHSEIGRNCAILLVGWCAECAPNSRVNSTSHQGNSTASSYDELATRHQLNSHRGNAISMDSERADPRLGQYFVTRMSFLHASCVLLLSLVTVSLPRYVPCSCCHSFLGVFYTHNLTDLQPPNPLGRGF